MVEQESREIEHIRELLRTHPKGMTIEEISRLLPLNRTSTAKYLNTLLISGQAEMRSFGRAKVFSLSQRVPVSHLISLSSDLIMILDRDLVVTHINDPFLEILGLERNELVGHKIDNTPFAQYFEPTLLAAIHTSAEGREMVTEQRVKSDEKELYFITKIIPVVFDDGSQGLSVILEDITELKKYQHHLERLVEERTAEIVRTNADLQKEISDHKLARDALAVANRKLNLLASVTRHDILNKITAISGYIQLLEEGLSGDRVKKSYIGKINDSIHSISDEITFTRDYKDLGVQPPEWQDINEIIRKLKEHEVFATIRIVDETRNLKIYADPFLDKVFSNLFYHSVHFGAAKTIRVSEITTNGKCTILVEDDGTGIAAPSKNSLFDIETGRKLGFHLLLAKEILSITGISIREMGNPDKGARYEIIIPAGHCKTTG